MNVGTNFAPGTDEQTNLQRISQLVLHLSIVAADTNEWELFRYGNENKGVVIDRLENQISHYIREAQKELQSLAEKAQGKQL